MNRELESVKDLIEYLQTLPQDAAPFTYAHVGGFLSLDTGYFKYDAEQNTLYFDYQRYEDENEQRIAEGKEWSDDMNVLSVVFVREDKFGRAIYRDTKTNQECMTASGVWFTVTKSGAPLSPIMCDKVTIDYRR